MYSARGNELVSGIIDHFNRLHDLDRLPVDFEIERMMIDEAIRSLEDDKSHLNFKEGLVTFSPSSASKCERELFYKAFRYSEHVDLEPYHKRWTRNATAVHAAVQKDLLYAEKYLENPSFNVVRTKRGNYPAWEKNVRTVRQFEHNGVEFQEYGMMDGVLLYNRDGSKIGFEFKTKSTTLGVIGDYKMKDAETSHKEQCVAYSLLFGLDEFIIFYESLAKDGWTKGKAAKPDIRAFYYYVTEADRREMLDKWAFTADRKYRELLPPGNFEKCFFCKYKGQCADDQALLGAV
jgi:hypothetical protein